MSKIVLSQPAGGFNLSAINQNFQKIQDEFNNKVLYRQNTTGEPNQMVGSNLDMGSNRILNLPAPVSPNEPARLKDVQDSIGNQATALLTKFVPYGDIVATNVQGAIQEVDDTLNDIYVSIKRFGAVGNNAALDSAAWEAMVDYCASNGVDGYIPAGTFLINPSIRTFVSNKPFTIRGAGVGISIIKNSNSAASFIYWTGANNVSFKDFTIDGSYTGLPSTPVAGGTLVLQNTNYNTIQDINFINIYRIALLVYNDHQTITTNVYNGIHVRRVKVFGPSNWIGNVGPDAFILADVNNSTIEDCYINNIGRFGYEFKNDSSNTVISRSLAEDCYYPLYYGGDGSHTELGYVKNSLISDCIVRRAQSGNALHLTTASNNIIRNVSIDQTGVAGGAQTVYITSGSNSNSITGIDLEGRSTAAANIVTSCNGNVIEFSNLMDGTYTGKGITGIASDCANNTVIFGTRDSTQPMFLTTYVFNNNTVIDRALHVSNYPITVNALKKIRFGDVGTDTLPGSAAGLAVVGTTAQIYQISSQTYNYHYFGSFTNYNLSAIRGRTTDGVLFFDINSAATSYLMDAAKLAPVTDNTLSCGGASNRWSVIYAGTSTINTSDAREKQQIRCLSEAEQAVAVALKGLVRMYKFNDAVTKKGDEARWHTGVMAQDIQSAFAAQGLDGFSYGVLCHDTWDAQPEQLDEEGNVLEEAVEAGDRYGIRYEELFSFIIAAL